METYPTSMKNVVIFSVMEIDYSTPLINVCSETSIQQKRLPTSVKNVVLFSVIKTDTTSGNNVVLFSVMETYYSTPLITVCSETSIQNIYLPTSVNNVVLIFSYGYRLEFSEECDTFSQLWGHINQPL